jgi:gliding motility-associated-like protein
MNYSASEDNNLLINFEAYADKVTDWKWDFGDRQTASSQNPAHTYGKKGNYKVSVTAKNSVGCSTVVVKEVNLKLDLLAPTAFTPDGDGINDTWMPVALLNGDYVFTLTVADKAGNEFFKTSDKNRAWDGQKAKTGDTFIWRAVVKERNGEESNHQGLITISE